MNSYSAFHWFVALPEAAMQWEHRSYAFTPLAQQAGMWDKRASLMTTDMDNVPS